MNIAFLACPYSHPDPKIKKLRVSIVTKTAYDLMNQGILVYSSLIHNTPIEKLGFHGDGQTWKDFDRAMLSRCDRLIVIKLAGWEESKGVAAAIALATKLNLPIEWMECTKDQSLTPSEEESSSYEDLLSKMNHFYTERDWGQFHSPKNLAINISVEVGELLEHFRWVTEAQSYIECPKTLGEVQDEIGDVFLVLANLSRILGIDPIKAAKEKLTKMAVKYPVAKSKGRTQKYTAYETVE